MHFRRVVLFLGLLFTFSSPVFAKVDSAVISGDGDDGGELLQRLLGMPSEPDPVVECPKLGNCVPAYRFSGEVTQKTVGRLAKWITAARTAGAKALVVELNSPGGAVDAGFEMSKAIEDAGVPVHCVVDGRAMSMAYYVLQSCNTRSMTKRSQLMIHEPRFAADYGNSQQELKNGASALRVLSRAMAEHSAGRMHMSVEAFNQHVVLGQDWNMDWSEGLKVGAIDQIVASVRDLTTSLQARLQLPKPPA